MHTNDHFLLPRCAGMNCGATDANHSPECRAEHAAAVAGGRFVKGATPIAERADADTAGAKPTSIVLLAEDHKGMRADYSGMFKQARLALARGGKEPGLAEMLRQLQEHITELGTRWYAGDTAVVDELLQLYCVEKGARDALVAATPASSVADAAGASDEPVAVIGRDWQIFYYGSEPLSDAALTKLLPGAYYMDPPDGGSVTLLEQLERMSQDAKRYRCLRNCYSERERMDVVNQWDGAMDESLDAAIEKDAAILAANGEKK